MQKILRNYYAKNVSLKTKLHELKKFCIQKHVLRRTQKWLYEATVKKNKKKQQSRYNHPSVITEPSHKGSARYTTTTKNFCTLRGLEKKVAQRVVSFFW